MKYALHTTKNIAYAAYYDYEIWQIDVKTAFLNGFLDEESVLLMLIIPESQDAYLDKILKRYRMDDSKQGAIPVQVDCQLDKSQCTESKDDKACMQNVPYASAVGSIMYDVRCLMWLSHKTSQADFSSCGNSDAELQVKCYCDARFKIDRDDMKSQTGYVFTLNGGAVVLKSSKQSTTAQHAAEAEHIAAAEAVKEAVWIRKFVDELGVVPSNNYPIEINCDNTSAISMVKEPGIMKRARHFQRKFHYVRECVETGKIKMVIVHTDDNLADPFTKALAGPKLTLHARSMGLRPASSFM
nr:hypothetical protein [Tanacetum cinerariifolium]